MTQMNLHMKRNRLIDIENRPVIVKGEEIWRRDRLGFGVIRCKPQHIGWIYNKVLLYSTAAAAAKSLSRVRLCATPKTTAHQAPPSLGFSRQEHWSGLPFPSSMHESEK